MKVVGLLRPLIRLHINPVMLYRQYINNNNQVSRMRHPTNDHVDFTFIKPDRESCVFASLSEHTKIVMEGDKMLS